VSPFLKDLQRDDLWQFHTVNKTFYKSDFNFAKLKKLIPVSYVLYSDNDPYVPKEFEENFAKKLGSSAIIIQDGGHLNAEAGFTQFPLLVELCKTRLRVNHYINN
jgi:predicted alpha/beta hydrolase family esterase